MDAPPQVSANSGTDSLRFDAGVLREQSNSVHKLPEASLVDRGSFLVDLSRGKTVVDLGFVDEGRMEMKLDEDQWLHARIAATATSVVGIDSNVQGVADAVALGFTAYVADCENVTALQKLRLPPADLVIAGELIEHLSNPGRFLDAVSTLVKPTGRLAITTPNGLSLTNTLAGLMHREFVNPDHTNWQSWHTVATLLGRAGWTIERLAYYAFPTESLPPPRTPAERRRTKLFKGYLRAAYPLFKLRPGVADGLIVVAGRT